MAEDSNSKAPASSEPQQDMNTTDPKAEDEEVEIDAASASSSDEDATAAEPSTPATTLDGASKSKKKRKPRKKKPKSTSPASSSNAVTAPDPSMMQRVTDVKDIPALLKQLALQNNAKAKEGKAPEDYKFWNTQPVPKFREPPNLLQTTNGSSGGEETLPEGSILPDKVCKASVKPEPEPLLEGFEWCLVDLENAAELQELYDLLYNHYVEDTDGSFRFNYSAKFLAWALKPPGYNKDWHIGIRASKAKNDGDAGDAKPGKLVAFIAGVPAKLKVRGAVLGISEINFLTVHRKLRSKRLAPVLIKEVTRRCYQVGVYQALYTAGTLLPTPVTTARYFHRSLDWEHLYKTGFSHLPQGTSELRQKYKYRVETQTSLKGLRAMKTTDLPAVKALLTRYLERFGLRQEFDEQELEHWLCSKQSEGVVWSWVVEDGKGGISDFVSYYLLESTVLKSQSSPQQQTIRAAYLYYYASSSAFPIPHQPMPPKAALQATLQSRLQVLMHDALILAKKDDFHVFNALTIMDNPLFLQQSKFEPGDGKLHYYLFNWRTAKLGGGVNDNLVVDEGKMGGVGVVML
ncbi:glycylpeptide N-tetradecanoyltransferase [Elasticomyces elasticus]|nr:glycylpeptide N-tetradecanoyltransferase [Elasticomyces elasticus]KAK3656120.1 glycylpeptide N-tetradecanoyltransferase [Elasticomyces elasticus]KAK4922325.1 glycylpeptide N-tetradecanoyltransferase [Elasticomyces elasticus]KAK5763779.1 glycylpeptide N-tetradecanoyltransferase [Elasticomyces elasticus]